MKGVHSMELVRQYDRSVGTASFMMSLRTWPEGPMKGSCSLYSDAPGASPMKRISMRRMDWFGMYTECVTLCLQKDDISHLAQEDTVWCHAAIVGPIRGGRRLVSILSIVERCMVIYLSLLLRHRRTYL